MIVFIRGKSMSMNEIINAIELIKQFLDSGDSLTTAEWETDDGTILRCDWGYFLEGLYEIEGYAIKSGGKTPEHRRWRNWHDSEFNSCFGKEQEHEDKRD